LVRLAAAKTRTGSSAIEAAHENIDSIAAAMRANRDIGTPSNAA
jgi:hypothetical protein